MSTAPPRLRNTNPLVANPTDHRGVSKMIALLEGIAHRLETAAHIARNSALFDRNNIGPLLHMDARSPDCCCDAQTKIKNVRDLLKHAGDNRGTACGTS